MPAAGDHLSLREAQKALTRTRLLDAAESVFARNGFAGASLEAIAREAGASTGAVYSNFAGKEDLFLALFEERIAGDLSDYSKIIASGETLVEQARGPADHWIRVLRERPHYFPLLIEFWSFALREPALRRRLAEQFATLRASTTRLVLTGAQRRGFAPNEEAAACVGLIIRALGHGLALEKLIDPNAVPDRLYGDMLALVFSALEALGREQTSTKGAAA